MCCCCFTTKNGYEPEMGDDATTFAQGTCVTCGKEGTVFTFTD
jgi:hypothetical protein